MRNEFAAGTKEELAKRVGYGCSNPACRQPTSGPRVGSSGAVNVGVAAHITGASPGGPRYDPTLTAAGRSSAANGIWLCQTCAKLIDSDEDRYKAAKLTEWKTDAEAAARGALEQRRSPRSESEGVFLEAERLMPDLVAEMRADVRGDETELVRDYCILPSPTTGYAWPRSHFRLTEAEHPDLLNKLEWLEEMGLVVNVTPGNMPVYRLTPAFAGWLRTLTER